MQEAREEADEKAQQELWNQCFDIIAEILPAVPAVPSRGCNWLLGRQDRRLQAYRDHGLGLHRRFCCCQLTQRSHLMF